MAYQGGYATGYGSGASPLILGSSDYHPRAAGYGARIDDYWVRLAPSREAPMRYYTQDSLAPRSDDRTSSEDNVLELGHVYTKSDVSGGAGLDYFPRPLLQDRRIEDNIRFWDSMNIDVSHPRYDLEQAIRLYRKLEQWNDLNTASAVVRTSDLLFVADGTYVRWFDTLANTVEEGSNNFTTTVDAVCALGDDVYVLTNNAIQKRPAGGSFAAWHTPAGGETIENIWPAKGRIMAWRTTSTTCELIDMADGTAEIPVDSYEATVEINDVVDAGPAIVVATNAGELHSYTLDNSDPPALQPTSITPVPHGENPLNIAYNQGTFTYLTVDPVTGSNTTVARFYAAEVLDSRFNFTIGNSQLIMEWDSSIEVTNRNVTNLLALRDDVWFATYEPDVGGDKYLSLYRYDIVTRGYNRAHAIGVTGSTNVKGLVNFEDRMVFVSDGDVWAESDTTYADVGWLITPMINFGLNTRINWIALVTEVTDMISGRKQIELLHSGQIEALKDWEHVTWQSELRLTSPEQADAEFPLVGIASKARTLQVRMYPHTTGSPGLRRFSVRGLPAHRDIIVELPVNISDLIEVPGRAPKISPRHGDTVHSRLLNMQGRNIELEVLDPPISILGIVDQILEPTEYLTARGSQGRMCMMRVRGKRITSGVAAIGTAGIGIARLGVSTIGIGEITELT